TAALLFPEHEMIKVHSFKEIHFGAFEGKTYEQLKEDSNYQRWMAQPFTVRPPKGETFVEFSNRIQKGWQFVRQKMITLQLTSIAIVTHGGVIRYLLSLFASNRQSFFTWSIPFAGGYRLIWTRGQFLQHKQAESVKSIEHVNDRRDKINISFRRYIDACRYRRCLSRKIFVGEAFLRIR